MSHASVASSRATTIAFEMFAALMPLTYSWSRWKDDNQWQSMGHQWLSMAFDDTQFVLNSCAHHAHIMRTSCAHHSHIIRTSFAHHSHIIRTESHSNTSGAPGACGRCSYWRRRPSEAIRSNQGNHLEHVEDVLIGDGGDHLALQVDPRYNFAERLRPHRSACTSLRPLRVARRHDIIKWASGRHLGRRFHLGAPFGEYLSREAIKRPSEVISGAPFGEHLSREAIKRPSEVISGAPFGEHLSREAIKRPSEAIRGHQRPSEAIKKPSEAIRGHQEAIRGNHLVSRGEDPRRQDRIGIPHHHCPLTHIWVGGSRGDSH